MKASPELRRAYEPSGWLRSRVGTALAGLVTGDTAACGHLSLPMFLTLWDGTIRCQPCAGAAGLALRQCDPAEDETCDRCRHQMPGQLTPTQLHYGHLLVVLGLCPECLAREGLGNAVG